MAYLAIFLGGGAGSVLRFAMSKAMVAQGWLQGHWATLVINVLASFALAVSYTHLTLPTILLV